MRALITLLTTFLFSINVFAIPGGGGGGGGGPHFLISSIPDLEIGDIESIETFDREILHRGEFGSTIQMNNGQIQGFYNTMNIELKNGQVLDL